jgi:hypothetical protein
MQGAQVRRAEDEAQRRRWSFYKVVNIVIHASNLLHSEE